MGKNGPCKNCDHGERWSTKRTPSRCIVAGHGKVAAAWEVSQLTLVFYFLLTTVGHSIAFPL